MRKLLLAIVVIFVLAGIGIAIYAKKPAEDPETAVAGQPSAYAKDIRFEMPEGMRLSYDVVITRRRSASASVGRVDFESVTEMSQTLTNIGKEDATSFKTFHMDVFRDTSVTQAKIGDQPMPTENANAMKDEDIRIFKYGTYLFNVNQMLNNGLPMEAPKVEKDADLVNAIVTYMQYFPSDLETNKEMKWTLSKKAGEYEVNYEFAVTRMVTRKGHVCAVVEGTATLGSAKLPKDIQIQPSTFRFWLSTDKHIIVRSEINLEFRVESKDIWTAIKMGFVKNLSKLEELNSVKVAQIRQYSQQLLDTERSARSDKRDNTQLSTWRGFGDSMIQLFGPEDPYTEGLKFLRENFIK